jgi:hypothetical protein
MESGEQHSEHRLSDLSRALRSRLDQGRPVIVEGVFLLHVLQRLELRPQVLIYMKRNRTMWSKVEHTGVAQRLAAYRQGFNPESKADVICHWSDS